MGRVYIGGEMLGGRYEIESYIDEGGMQEVYLARDRVFGREVVVKVPKNDSAVKRFKTTAVLSARVTHPNIAMTLDYFEEQGLAHLVEEYLPGGNLSDALMSHIEALDPHLVAKLLNHLSKGLAAAHHVDVVHRDLKPSNIVLNGDLSRFTPKITDFGVAKMAQEAMAIAVEGGASSITASKTAIGHLPYMAPELIEDAGRVRKPSDIWAIGALGYEMLSGTKPYGQGLLAVTAIMAAEPLTLPKFVSRSRDFRSLGCAVFTVIAACVKRDENARPTADALVAMTSRLCYGNAARKWGVVESRKGQTGTIRGDGNERVFFHTSCVYGPSVTEGDRVLYASFDGNPMPRAQPVVRARRS